MSPGQAGDSAGALGWLGAHCEPWAGWGISVSPGPAGSCFSLSLSDHPDGGRAFIFVYHLFMVTRTLKEHQEDHEEMSSNALTSWARWLCKYSELRTLISAGAIPLSIIGALEKETNGSQHADNNCFGKDQEAPAPADAGFSANTCPRTTFHLSLFFKLKPPKAKTSCAKGKK